jgi:leucyl-tRNA synthetase
VHAYAETGIASPDVVSELESRGLGGRVLRYKMRDWLISRQRYWGASIPIVYCERCGPVPLREEDLPVRLPDVERYEPSGTGRSPLAAIPEFVHATCPNCGGAAERETDTLDGFADSNWYFLRFADPHHHLGPWNPDAARYWLPVDWYVGGAEHAVMHLLYARFFTKVLFDAGLVPFGEPFVRLRNQGSMISPLDGTRMSKSRGNVVTPDEVVEQAGADALRVAVMFIGPFEQDVTWDPEAITGASRFVRRLYALIGKAAAVEPTRENPAGGEALTARMHHAVKTAGEAIERFRFNVLVAELMTLLNEMEGWERGWQGTPLWRDLMLMLLRIAAPVVPFVAEEGWSILGQTGSVHQARWPEFDPSLVAAREAVVVVQVDGRVRDRITVPASSERDGVIDEARARPRVQAALRGREVADVVVVPGRVVNFVTRNKSAK